MSVAIWFTADTHFGHANIIKHAKRPFDDVDQMDAEMIRRWNAVVKKHDQVYHLGDFTLASVDKAESYRKQLNGYIHLVHGNHDRNVVLQSKLWASTYPMYEISVDATPLTLGHYAMKVWNKSHHGALMLYGHSHGTLPGSSQSLDVGVDCWNYAPVSLKQIKEKMGTLPLYRAADHHGER